jgi:copper oxidase (laccase) domain-containing protein
VIERTIDAMGVPGSRLQAYLGPAIGPQAYEVGEEVRAAFLEKDGAAASAFAPTRPGHWRLDLYAIARQRLAAMGVDAVHGGTFCTYSEPERFFSYRRDRAVQRMAGCIWRV